VFVVQLVVTASCTTDPQQIESQQQVNKEVHNKLKDKQQVLQQVGQLVAQQVHNKSTASCMQQSASLTASRTTCCTADPQLIEVMESNTIRTALRFFSSVQFFSSFSYRYFLLSNYSISSPSYVSHNRLFLFLDFFF